MIYTLKAVWYAISHIKEIKGLCAESKFSSRLNLIPV